MIDFSTKYLGLDLSGPIIVSSTPLSESIDNAVASHPGVAGTMFRTLAERGINIQVISTSEIKVSVLVAAEYTELAVRALHTAYELDA